MHLKCINNYVKTLYDYMKNEEIPAVDTVAIHPSFFLIILY